MTCFFSCGPNPGAMARASCGAKISPRITRPMSDRPMNVITVEDPPGLIFAVFGRILGEDGDKCDAKRGAGDRVVEKIRQGKGRVIRVGHRIRADLMRDGPLAKKSEDAAEQDAAHHIDSGRDDAAIHARLSHVRHGRGRAQFTLGRYGIAGAKRYRAKGYTRERSLAGDCFGLELLGPSRWGYRAGRWRDVDIENAILVVDLEYWAGAGLCAAAHLTSEGFEVRSLPRSDDFLDSRYSGLGSV